MPTPDLSLIVYCRNDPVSGRWAGLDALLSELQCDQNVYTLATATQWLLDNYTATVSLASISQPTPSSLLFTFTDATTQGPFDLPVAVFTDQGDWAIDTPYIVNDTFNAPNGGMYRVIFNHTSSHTSFDPAANDGMGHDFYAAMIPPRGNTIPAGGAVAMYFRKNSTSDYDANWAFIRAGEIVFSASSDSALTSTTVADAIEEVERLIPTGFDSTAITYSPTAWLTATNVSDALGQLANINAINVAFSPTTDSALISTTVADAVIELEGLIATGGSYQPLDADLTALAANSTDGLWAHTGAGTGAARTITQGTGITVTNGDGVSGNPTVAVTAAISTGAIEVVIDGGGSTITTGLKGYLSLPIAGTITEAKLLADQSGSIVVDIFKCTYAQFDAGSTHPVSGDKITSSTPPTISSATKSQDTTLSSWTTAFSAGDVMAFNVNSVTSHQRVTLSLKYTK